MAKQVQNLFLLQTYDMSFMIEYALNLCSYFWFSFPLKVSKEAI